MKTFVKTFYIAEPMKTFVKTFYVAEPMETFVKTFYIAEPMKTFDNTFYFAEPMKTFVKLTITEGNFCLRIISTPPVLILYTKGVEEKLFSGYFFKLFQNGRTKHAGF